MKKSGDMATAVDVLIKIVVALGGLAGAGAFLTVRAQKRKLIADSNKTTAEADGVVAEAQAKRTAREISLLAPYERVHARMAGELDDAYREIERLKLWVSQLTSALKAAGIDVPDEPPRVTHHAER